MVYKSDHISSFVETTNLPKITVSGKGGDQFDAYVNAYVVGQEPEQIMGKEITPLYYLSLVAPYGHGTVLQGIFARLTSSTSKGRGVFLDGVGDVVLAHHRQRLNTSGYTLHWNYEQAEVAPTRDIHAIIESNMLTICDPVRGTSVKTRNVRSKGIVNEARKRARKERTSLSTVKNNRAITNLAEMHERERFPAFLLMIPGWQQGNKTYRQQQHLAFLDPRVPWPLDPAWAEFLWWRGEKRGEIEPLTVWCSTSSTSRAQSAQEAPSASVPFLAEAYLCCPDPGLMQRDLQDALIRKHLPSRLHSHLTVLPPVQPVPQIEPDIVAHAVHTVSA